MTPIKIKISVMFFIAEFDSGGLERQAAKMCPVSRNGKKIKEEKN